MRASVWLCLACGSHALIFPPSGLQVRPRASGLESGLWRALANQRQAHEQWQRSGLPMMSERVPSVNKQALVDAIAQKAGVSKKTAAVVLTATLDVIVDSVCDGHKVSLIGFGSFQSKDRPKREARNPKTGEKMIVEAVRLAPKLRTHPALAPTQRDAGAFTCSLSPSRLP
jgi:DNA-binding protein HU-beta